MTPLAMKVAHELAIPLAKRTMDDRAQVLSLINQDLHCFEATAIAKAVHEAMEAENLWPDVESMAPRMFLPSPVTWLEMKYGGQWLAWVLEDIGEGWFRMSLVQDGFSLPVSEFRARSILEAGDRIEQKDLTENVVMGDRAIEEKTTLSVEKILAMPHQGQKALEAKVGMLDLAAKKLDRERRYLDFAIDTMSDPLIKHGIATCILMLDLINTPGLIGLRQHDPHRGLARKLQAYRSGSYPLRGWSEVVLKHQTRIADDVEHPTGATYHKCLHFVRSHRRHYRNGHVSIIPAHWRGDPALGIKRTRYRLAA